MTEGRFRRAYLGLGGGERPLPPRLARQLDQRGCVEVVQVVTDSPAAKAGLRDGDLIVAVDGQKVGSMNDLQRLMIGERIGSPVAFTVGVARACSRSASSRLSSKSESLAPSDPKLTPYAARTKEFKDAIRARSAQHLERDCPEQVQPREAGGRDGRVPRPGTGAFRTAAG